MKQYGCETLEDLADVEEQDMMEVGLKKIEITRLKRFMHATIFRLGVSGRQSVDVYRDALGE